MNKTPLNEFHRSLGANLVPFAGYEMPVFYSGIQDEHLTVRSKAGLFDLGHMGRVRVRGKDAEDLLGRAQTYDAGALPVGRTRYALILAESGGVQDDILISKENDGFLLVVNASNRAADLATLRAAGMGLDAAVIDDTDRISMIAVQGPAAVDVLDDLGLEAARSIGYYRFATHETAFGPVLVSRTGYTGEDGFELLAEAGATVGLFKAALERGHRHGLKPCGLGARDTLRLEAGMPLYGHEMDLSVLPDEAGLSHALRSKRDYLGRAAIEAARKTGIQRELVGLVVHGPHIPRQGSIVRSEGRDIGVVCSGTRSPTLQCNIATALVVKGSVGDSSVSVIIRRHEAEARRTPLPFYKRTEAANTRTPSDSAEPQKRS